MAEPTLMYCVGATKAGTSWLHRYLFDHPEAHVRGVKELHYFDALAAGDWARPIRSLRTQLAAQRARAEDEADPEERARARRMAADTAAWLRVVEDRRCDDAAYLGYLCDGIGERRLMGDVTPAYGLLSEGWLRTMAGLWPKTRFVYLMRDPVDRLWSHCRMIAARRSQTPLEIRGRAIRILRRVFAGKEPEIAARSDYAGPLARMRAALAPEQLFLGFYEELFRDRTIAALCRFLGLTPAPADHARPVLKGPQAAMAPGQWRTARAFLDDQYTHVRESMHRLPERWASRTAEV